MSKQFAQPPLIYLSPPNNNNNLDVTSSNLDTKISPSILLIIIILAIIFFISGLLHLLVRCLLRSTQRDPDDVSNVTALQGQLRQLFHLHDSGVDQSYIDTLPVFHYKAIIGVKDPFDCAVCLCEFEPDDKLRLLPKCSHAFHMECIDTWLLSHSTCPLCRYCLINDFSSGHVYPNPIPVVCVLESGGESDSTSREIRESGLDPNSRISQVELESGQVESGQEEEKVVMIKLGKFGSTEENVDMNENEESVSRRCYSMGSFAYVLDEGSSLQVQVKELMKEKSNNKRMGVNRGAMSEYGGNDSRREFNGIGNGNKKNESFSVSKIWQRGMEKEREWKRNDHGLKGEFFNGLESFQNGNGNENDKIDSFSISKIWQRGTRIEGTEERERKENGCRLKRTISEIEIEDGEIERGDEETQSIYSVDSITNSTNNHRRTLLWLMGRHNKVVHHNHSSSCSSVV